MRRLRRAGRLAPRLGRVAAGAQAAAADQRQQRVRWQVWPLRHGPEPMGDGRRVREALDGREEALDAPTACAGGRHGARLQSRVEPARWGPPSGASSLLPRQRPAVSLADGGVARSLIQNQLDAPTLSTAPSSGDDVTATTVAAVVRDAPQIVSRR